MKRWLWCLAAVAAFALTACGATSKQDASTGKTTTTTAASTTTTVAPTTTTVTPSTTTVAPSAASSTTTTTAGTTRATAAICATSQLAGSLSHPSGTAGSIDYQLELTNVSSTTCVLQGFPGVSFVAGSDGHQVGATALWPADLVPQAVTLVAGGSGYAPLAIADAENYPPSSCQLTTVLGLRVYPPGEYTALYIPHADQTCANTHDPVLSADPFYPTPTD